MNNVSFGRTKRTILSLGLLSSITLLAGCGGSSNKSEPIVPPTPSSSAVVQTAAPDFSSSEVAYVDFDAQTVMGDYYVKDKSDYTVASHGTDVYHIGRFNINTIEKYSNNARDQQIFSFTTQDAGQATTSNPYTLVFANDNKAYLLRYGSAKVWIVNPNATEQAEFKTGELDLSAYIPTGNTKGTPSPSAAVVADGKLYITMQRLSDDFSANPAYVAVYDTATDTEIETNNNSEDTVKGILLAGINPLENSVKFALGDVFVTTRNTYFDADVKLTASRIEKIETSDYSVSTVLSAADIADNENTFIFTSEIVSDTKGYFVANTDTYPSTSTLYEFNPASGAIVASNVAETGEEDISFIGLDKSDFLWVSTINPSTPGIDVINTTTNAKEGSRLLTTLNPKTVKFLD